MAINTQMKPDTLARRAAEDLARRKQDATNGYSRSIHWAAKSFDDYQRSGRTIDLEVANDWVEGANRWKERAAELGIELEEVLGYQADGSRSKLEIDR